MKRTWLLLCGFVFLWGAVFTLSSCHSSSKPSENTTACSSDDWKPVNDIIKTIRLPEIPDRDYLITDFGAQPDGTLDVRPAIMAAIKKVRIKCPRPFPLLIFINAVVHSCGSKVAAGSEKKRMIRSCMREYDFSRSKIKNPNSSPCLGASSGVEFSFPTA